MSRLAAIATSLTLSVLASAAEAAEAGEVTRKLVKHGWDIPSPAYAREHVREMEKLPFDGTTIALRYGGGRVFSRERWDERTLAPEVEALAATEWRRFTENYLMLHAASDFDWTRDEDWQAVLANVRLAARAAHRGRLRGLCFDPEPYGNSPWNFRLLPERAGRSFEEMQELVRRRGRDFLKAIKKEMPEARLLTFFQLSVLFDAASRPLSLIPGCGGEAGLLESHPYALLPSFLLGWLDAAETGMPILDGNELAYYYTQPEEFYRAYLGIRADARCLLPPALHERYGARVGVAQAIFVDEVMGLRGPERPAAELTPREQVLWLEQNVYHALAASDGVTWLYSEQMDWWKQEKLPAGALDAIVRARRKLERRERLGFDISERLEAAKRATAR